MDTSIIEIYHDKLKDLVGSDFEKELLEASLKNLLDSDNKLRFNNFACGIRELSRHVLSRLAPDDEILKCGWYKNETGKVGQTSRGEKVKYAIQAGLPDEFLETFFDVEDYKYEVLQAINLLNKYTHVNKDTFAIPESEVDELSEIVVEAYSGLVKAIIDCRRNLKSELEEHISEALLEHTIYESIDDIDILSTHHNVEEVYVSEYHISELGSTQLLLEVDGSIDVRQQYGSNSDLANDIGFEWNSSFPFSSKVTMKFTAEFPKNADVDKFDVNTDSWYE